MELNLGTERRKGRIEQGRVREDGLRKNGQRKSEAWVGDIGRYGSGNDEEDERKGCLDVERIGGEWQSPLGKL